jgi:putative two-component system response regulator
MRVLVVDDDPVTAELLKSDLNEFGYNVALATDGNEAFDLIRTGLYRLVISDWQMPNLSGIELCRKVRQRDWAGYIYFILLTSRTGLDNVVCGLEAGADDFMTKPFHPLELRMRLRTGERVLALEGRDLMIFAMAKLAESRDEDTGAHLERIREYCRILSEELSSWDKYRDVIDGDYVQLIYQTSPLHDIGKVGIPDSVLLKPGRLTPEEFEIMKRHTMLGGETLESVVEALPEARFLHMARDIAMTHHEWFDGHGYPRGLAGEAIPLSGRIVALADVYDALRSKRVYKQAYSHERAHEIITKACGTQFDPDIVRAFLNREDEFVAVARRFDDAATVHGQHGESAERCSATESNAVAAC